MKSFRPRKFLFFALVLFLLPHVRLANAEDKKNTVYAIGTYSFTGSLADKYLIHMTLKLMEDGNVRGIYSYDKHPEQTLFLEGNLDSKGWLYLGEYISAPSAQSRKVNAAFSGSLGADNSINGTWTAADKLKRIPFSLKGMKVTDAMADQKITALIEDEDAKAKIKEKAQTLSGQGVAPQIPAEDEDKPRRSMDQKYSFITHSKEDADPDEEIRTIPPLTKDALPDTLRRADAGDLTACAQMSLYYLCDEDLGFPCMEFDAVKAEHYARQAIKHGLSVGRCDSWAYGVEFPQDLTFAVECFEKKGDLWNALWLVATKLHDPKLNGISIARDELNRSGAANGTSISIPDSPRCPDYLYAAWEDDCFSTPGINSESGYEQDIKERRSAGIEKSMVLKYPQAQVPLTELKQAWEHFSMSWASILTDADTGTMYSNLRGDVIATMENDRSKMLKELLEKPVLVQLSLVKVDASAEEKIRARTAAIRSFLFKKLDGMDPEDMSEEQRATLKTNIDGDLKSLEGSWNSYAIATMKLMKQKLEKEKPQEPALIKIEARSRQRYLAYLDDLLKNLRTDGAQ
jgi:hypothetical protein